LYLSFRTTNGIGRYELRKKWKGKTRTNQPKVVLAEPILPIHHCLGKWAPRLVGGLLSLDDAGDRWAYINTGNIGKG